TGNLAARCAAAVRLSRPPGAPSLERAGFPLSDHEPESTPGETPEYEANPEATEATEATAPEGAAATESSDAAGEEEPEQPETQVVFDDLDGQSLSDAIDATIVAFDDGDIVKGRVVKIDSDEVL